MTTNPCGAGDNFDLESEHVVPSPIQGFERDRREGAESKRLREGGSPFRELLHNDDLAHRCVTLLERYEAGYHISLGTGENPPTADLAKLVVEVGDCEARIDADTSCPDGASRNALGLTEIHKLN